MAAVAVTAGTFFPGYVRLPALSSHHPRLLVIGIPRLSWDNVVSGMRDGGMPWMSGLMTGESAWGDVIGEGYVSESQILGSIITGEFQACGSDNTRGGGRTVETASEFKGIAVWERMAMADMCVAVVGFPSVNGQQERAVYLVSGREGRGLSERRHDARVIRSDSIPKALLEDIAGSIALSEPVVAAIRAALADDLTAVGFAQAVAAENENISLFVYLTGLMQIDDALRSAPASDQGGGEWRQAVTAGYYEFVDGLCRRLEEAVSGEPAVVVFSEVGNDWGPVRCRPRAPTPEKWPPMGFFAASGPCIGPTVLPQMVAPADVSVTLLYMMGLPIPERMDGVILFGMLEDDFYLTHPIRVGP